MALLKEDNSFTHVIAIDFGTGASGYVQPHIDMLLHLGIPIKTARFVSRCSILAMEVTIKKHRLLSCLTMRETFWILV